MNYDNIIAKGDVIEIIELEIIIGLKKIIEHCR